MNAIAPVDAKKNLRFAPYAAWWIRAYITPYLKDNRSQVRGGESERQSMSDLSLDAAIDDDSDSTYLDQLEDPSPGPQTEVLGRETDEAGQAALGRRR